MKFATTSSSISAALALLVLVSSVAEVSGTYCPGNGKEDWWCSNTYGAGWRSRSDRSCYNDINDCQCTAAGYIFSNNKCECKASGYAWVNNKCEYCPGNTDKNGWCNTNYQYSGCGARAKSTTNVCVKDDDDCVCTQTDYYIVSTGWGPKCWFCPGNPNPTNWCQTEFGAVPKSGPVCFNEWEDCECPPGYMWWWDPVAHKKRCKNSSPAPTRVPTSTPPPPSSSPPSPRPSPTPEPRTPTADPPTWAWGDPHFRTWHGLNEFEFHGECDLVLMSSKKWDIDIHVRTTVRYDYSFISQAAVRIGHDVFEVASWGEYMWNDIETVSLFDGQATMGHEKYPITMTTVNKKKTIFSIHLGDDKDIELTTMKDYVSVKIENATKSMFDDAVGLMGDFETGSMLSRGKSHLEENPDGFGFEWQVRPEEDGVLFSEQRAPVYPQQCKMPTSAVHARRRLGETAGASSVTQEQAEAACAGWNDERDKCIQDVLKTGDLDLAEGF